MKVICEAGFFWRFVMHRLETRMNKAFAEGWVLGYVMWKRGLFGRLVCVAFLNGKPANS